MSDLRTINAKFLEESLKRGKRMHDFTSEFDTSEAEIIEYINKTFHERAAKNYIKRLKSKKPKTSDKKKKSTKKTKAIEPEVTVVETTVIQEAEPEHVLVSEVVPASQSTALDLLLQKEAQLSAVLCQLEISHESKVSQRGVLKNKLRDQYAQINELETTLNELLESFNSNVDKFNSLGDEMKELTVSITEKRNELEAHRKEIAKAKKVSMFIFANGEMEIESQCDLDFSVDTDKAHAVFNVLIQVEASENLTIKCLRTLATVSLIVEKLKFENIQYEINFDNETMQEVLNIVSQEN